MLEKCGRIFKTGPHGNAEHPLQIFKDVFHGASGGVVDQKDIVRASGERLKQKIAVMARLDFQGQSAVAGQGKHDEQDGQDDETDDGHQRVDVIGGLMHGFYRDYGDHVPMACRNAAIRSGLFSGDAASAV